MTILVINPGATSTKIAIFENEQSVFAKNIEHDPEALKPLPSIVAQKDLRLEALHQVLAESPYASAKFDAVAARGGLFRHIPSGTYLVNEAVLQDANVPPWGEHASNLGVVLADAIAREHGCKAYFTDPVATDELQDIARPSGCKGMPRESFFHALNQRAVARRACAELGLDHKKARLIVVHLGGGVSVVAHKEGRMIDITNPKDEGSLSMDRGGGLPVMGMIKYCFSGVTRADVKRRLEREAGLYSYVGTTDFKEIVDRAFNEDGSVADERCAYFYEVFRYQICKDVGAIASVLDFDVDALVFTGGISHSKRLMADFQKHTEKLCKTFLAIPGEFEMVTLAANALEVLEGKIEALDYEKEHAKLQAHLEALDI